MLDRAGPDEDHGLFREAVRRFMEREVTPNLDQWEDDGVVSREVWRSAGEAGLLCPTITEPYGGLGLDFRYNAIVTEELCYTGAVVSFGLQSDITAPYILNYGSEEQKREYLPRMVSGELISAIAMTEPNGGSDLKNLRTDAKRDGDHYVINGAKTYITNGQLADIVLVACRTGGEGSRGISLILVHASDAGFSRGRNLDKIGQNMADTSELFFNDVRVPADRLLGEENRAFYYMMQDLPQERLTIAVGAQAVAQRAFDEAVRFTRERRAFGQAVFEFQNTRFVLAGLKAKLQAGWAHLDWAIDRHVRGEYSPEEAAAGKLFHTELQWEVVDAALQLHGGAGYMNEYLIARLWRDARVQRIYGGSSEIMKEVISRTL
ncbi:acyl-CoA dehydrogenase family protein [Sphingomonas colocasiae]|uniref:Acyl-[acyl-carrier-protein] dehydrogenase MbtN n=1 Tax=Sphingomonas colocasiae TaxID=1848973 RepID=A0ABS7PUJ5_9SPHN|nr:acyl-CoA dehydrogenase family protein [Sphingomonas colocasiae]MBY8824340.1 acyl-CoA dehydrogenase family protein [Sphingomonas colocasiae]